MEKWNREGNWYLIQERRIKVTGPMPRLPLSPCPTSASCGAYDESRPARQVPHSAGPHLCSEGERGWRTGAIVLVWRMAGSCNEGEFLRESIREMMSDCEAMQDEAKALEVRYIWM